MQQLVYDRHPLDSSSQIRLLELKVDTLGQPRWSFAAPINVITTKNIKNNVEFAALSYEWGESERTVAIEIDGETLGIRKNLMRFLHALPELRAKQNTLPTLFWIDSMCINQSDDAEKPHQIRLLPDIYRRATCVISWLGPTANRSNSAMDYVQGLVRKEEDAVTALLNRRYWSRLWMVQEVVLGNAWWIASGVDIVDGDLLTRLIRSTHAIPYTHARHWQRSKAWNLIEERHRFRHHGPTSLVELLLSFFDLDARYKMDKIRALLALCPDAEITSRMHDFLAPYSADPEAFNSRAAVREMIETVSSVGPERYRPPYGNFSRPDDSPLPDILDWRNSLGDLQDLLLCVLARHEAKGLARKISQELGIYRFIF